MSLILLKISKKIKSNYVALLLNETNNTVIAMMHMLCFTVSIHSEQYYRQITTTLFLH